MALGLFGGAAMLGSALIGAKGQERAANAAARASRFTPPDITTGTGTVSFDRGTGFTAELAPELQALRDQLIGAGATGLEQFQTFDPLAAGQLFTQQLNQLAAPGEQQKRLGLENRLFKQGLLGSTTGAKRAEALESALATAQGQRDLTGLQFGQDQQARLFQNALQAIQGGTALDALTSQQINQAITAGGRQAAAGATGAQFQFQAGQNRADAISNFFGQLGQNINLPSSDGLFTQPVAGQTQAEMIAAQNAGLF